MIQIRAAHLDDISFISSLVDYYAQIDILLPKNLEEIQSELGDFVLAEGSDGLYGCAMLKESGKGLAELRTLAVNPEVQGQGVGRQLVDAILAKGFKEGFFKNIFVLTYEDQFFKKLGFDVIDKSQLPQKVWTDCMKCSKFFDCHEIAMMINEKTWRKYNA